jgi:hypothetical protein
MGLIRPSVLLFAMIITLPALYRFAAGQLDLVDTLARFLIAVPVAAVLLAGLRFVTASYGKDEEQAVPVTPTPMEPSSARPAS